MGGYRPISTPSGRALIAGEPCRAGAWGNVADVDHKADGGRDSGATRLCRWPFEFGHWRRAVSVRRWSPL
jgi:hypothetical protein